MFDDVAFSNARYKLLNLVVIFDRKSERERETERNEEREERNCVTRFQGSCLHTDGITSGLISRVAPRWRKSQAGIKKHLQDRHTWLLDSHRLTRMKAFSWTEISLSLKTFLSSSCRRLCGILMIPIGLCCWKLFRTGVFFAVLFGATATTRKICAVNLMIIFKALSVILELCQNRYQCITVSL